MFCQGDARGEIDRAVQGSAMLRMFLVVQGEDPTVPAPGIPTEVNATAGSDIVLDIFLENTGPVASDRIGSYELRMECAAQGGTSGSVDHINDDPALTPLIDDDRPDWIFADVNIFGLPFATNGCPSPDSESNGPQVFVSIAFGASGPTVGVIPKYLGTFAFHVSDDADGSFTLVPICTPPEQCQANLTFMLSDPNNETLPFDLDGAVVTIQQCVTNADCDDGVFCNGPEVCGASFTCEPGTPETCDDGVGCTVDGCNVVTDECENFPNDAVCNNGQFCDGIETCHELLDCQDNQDPNCSDGVDCTVDTCNEGTDSCDHAPDHPFCDNGQFCDGVEACDVLQDCVDSPNPDCSDGVGCTVDSCDEIGDACVHTPDNSVCDNGVFCDGSETCHPTNDCQAGITPICNDDVACTIDFCDVPSDTCANDPNDALCDNGITCDGAEVCNAVQDCQPGFFEDCNNNFEPDLCEVESGTAPDCNGNEIPDECDIDSGAALDCNGNGVPDFCDVVNGDSPDCDGNEIPDECDIADGTAQDCNGNDTPDICDIAEGFSDDCDGNGVPDECQPDCDNDNTPDICELPPFGQSSDCNGNTIPDECDIDIGGSLDCNANGIPDECEEDCNQNAVPDECDVDGGSSPDCNANGIPDECDAELFIAVSPVLAPIGSGFPQSFTVVSPPTAGQDVSIIVQASADLLAPLESITVFLNGQDIGLVFSQSGEATDCAEVPDVDAVSLPAGTFNTAVGGGNALIELVAHSSVSATFCPDSFAIVRLQYQAFGPDDCNGSGIPDDCDISDGTSDDCNLDQIPDECQADSDGDGTIDFCDNCELFNPNQADCQPNGTGDVCDIADGTSFDEDFDGIPDECVVCSTNPDCDDADPCTTDLCILISCEFPPRLYGDVNNDGVSNIVDVICSARVIFQSATVCGSHVISNDEIDIAPSAVCGDGLLNIVDLITFARAAFQGAVDECCSE